jgi:hypothetical protein
MMPKFPYFFTFCFSSRKSKSRSLPTAFLKRFNDNEAPNIYPSPGHSSSRATLSNPRMRSKSQLQPAYDLFLKILQQERFTTAVNYAGCVIDDELDPTCACTSYSLANTDGGHMTGIQYARTLCVPEADCSNDELGTFNNALENLCYNKEYSPSSSTKLSDLLMPKQPITKIQLRHNTR